MSQPMTSAVIAAGAGRSSQILGRLCLWAGVLGAASGVLLAAVPPAVGDDRYSYPLTASAFVAIQCWFVVQHLGLLGGIVGFGWSGATGSHRLGSWTAASGMLLLTATEAAAITAAGFDYSGTWTGLLDILYGASTIAVGAGLVAAGVCAVRSRTWVGWRRWVALATGVYTFVPLIPLMFAGFLGARLVITGWMLLFALLGQALIGQRRS